MFAYYKFAEEEEESLGILLPYGFRENRNIVEAPHRRVLEVPHEIGEDDCKYKYLCTFFIS